ncbi:MAG TPA: cytochrome C oxidase subunit IV family protein [Candidatus Binatia bacterium]|nr:cytochrome C oxidase subunit IV family protein [Candidatus Binatia bacterium]
MPAEHVAPVRLYLAVFACLLGLTALTTAIAFADLGRLNTVIMLAIAVTKATLVALFFMHLWWNERLTRVAIGGALAWLLLLIGLTLADVLTRATLG